MNNKMIKMATIVAGVGAMLSFAGYSGQYSADDYTQQYLYQRIETAEKNCDWANAIRFVQQDMSESGWFGSAALDAGSLVHLSLATPCRGNAQAFCLSRCSYKVITTTSRKPQ
ncbi:MAG: hypothetical protein ACI4R9_06855 [Kiritimatiellia bacterium]